MIKYEYVDFAGMTTLICTYVYAHNLRTTLKFVWNSGLSSHICMNRMNERVFAMFRNRTLHSRFLGLRSDNKRVNLADFPIFSTGTPPALRNQFPQRDSAPPFFIN